MRPRFPTTVRLRTPGPPTTDPETGNEVPGPVVETTSPAYLSQRAVANVSMAIEDRARQTTVISLYTLLLPAGTPITSETRVVDTDGWQYEVEGDPAERRSLRRPAFIAAALRRISDLQP